QVGDMRRWSTSIFIMLFANCLAVHWLQGVCTSFVGLAVKSRFILGMTSVSCGTTSPCLVEVSPWQETLPSNMC
ncbi:hypothetical protein V8C86DRAFT_2541497, partial [Haematococcus lacustris]